MRPFYVDVPLVRSRSSSVAPSTNASSAATNRTASKIPVDPSAFRQAPSTSIKVSKDDARDKDKADTRGQGSSTPKVAPLSPAKVNIEQTDRARKREANTQEKDQVNRRPVVKKAKVSDPAAPKKVYCHQDHKPVDLPNMPVLRCAMIVPKRPGGTATRTCNTVYCKKCLENRYDEDVDSIVQQGKDSNWACPICRKICNCSSCRKQAPSRDASFGTAHLTIVVAAGTTAGSSADRQASTSAVPGTSKPKATSYLKGNTKQNAAPVPAVAPSSNAAPSEPKRRPPRAPPRRRAPHTLPLSSPYYPHDYLPSSESILYRLNLREFFMRFSDAMPVLDLSIFSTSVASSTRASSNRSLANEGGRRRSTTTTTGADTRNRTTVAAKTLSCLANDPLWIWSDPNDDPTVGEVQLVVLEALVELLSSEKTSTGLFDARQYDTLREVEEAIEAARGLARARKGKGANKVETDERPWTVALELLSDGEKWTNLGHKWSAELRASAERDRRAKGGRSSRDDGDEGRGGRESPTGEEADGRDRTTGEERLAICSALVDLAYSTDTIRDAIQQGTEEGQKRLVALRHEKTALRSETTDERQRLVDRKSILARKAKAKAGDGAKKYTDEISKLEQKLLDNEKEAARQAERLQHDTFVAASTSRCRFGSIGTDALSNAYYVLCPPPSRLVKSTTAFGRDAKFPLVQDPRDVDADYPISYSVVVHGQNPHKAHPASKSPVKAGSLTRQNRSPTKRSPAGIDELEWFAVRGHEDIVGLIDWIEYTTKRADYESRLAAYRLEYPDSSVVDPSKAQSSTRSEVDRLREVVEGVQVKELVEAIRQFEGFTGWQGDGKA
ncbi:hypothetical protein JCM10212_005813 [Sporobolomyces blumeae]